MKKLSLICAFVFLLTCLAPAALARGTYLGYATVINCNEWVTLRSSASTKASSVCKVPLGASVEAYYYNSEFSECYYLGLHGYILNAYLSTSSSPSPWRGEYLGMMRVSFCNEWVTLRSQPSTSAATVTRVPLGDYVEAYYYNSEFAECYYSGLHGYILMRYLY